MKPSDPRLFFLLNVAQQAIRQRADALGIERTGLTSAQMGVLFFVAKNDGCLLKDVAKGMGLKNAAITGLMARMEKSGCVTRKASERDARATHLHLTAKGKRKLVEIQRLTQQLGERLAEGFTPAELQTVSRFLLHTREVARTLGQSVEGEI